MEALLATRIQIRRGVSSEWSSVNPTLASGEIGFETDTLKIKIGNGIDSWNDLDYATTGAVGDLFNKSVDDLDDINDGTLYQKLLKTDKAALDANLSASTSHIADASIHTELTEIQRLAFVGAAAITKEATGFYSNTALDNSDIDVSYNATTRKITLTGDFAAYWRGEAIPELVSGWQSEAHALGSGTYFLYYNGTSFVWDASPWGFDNLMIALVFRDTANFCLRECHGLMSWQNHAADHRNRGTYLLSGGDLYGYTLASTTLSERRPLITECRVADEDLTTIIPALSSELYTRLQLSLTGNTNLVTDQADIINLDVNRPYYNQFTGGNWVQTLFNNNEYGKIFVMAIPATSDADCQKTRFVFIQPQTVSATLSTIQAVTSASVNLGHIASALAEYVFIGEIIIRYTGGNWTLISYSKITGTRTSQTLLTGNYLSNVTTDASLTGDGTGGSPLSVVDSQVDHTLIQNIGTNSHAQIDTHIGTSNIHFTEASISHANILNIGTNTHSQIDTHIADSTIHQNDAALAAKYKTIIEDYENITASKTISKRLTFVDDTSGSVNLTLPSTTGVAYTVKKTAGSNATTMLDVIDGVANRTLFLSESITVIDNGTGWFLI